MGRNDIFKYINPSNPILKAQNAKSWKSRRRNDARSLGAGMIKEVVMTRTPGARTKPNPFVTPVKRPLEEIPSELPQDYDQLRQAKRGLFQEETETYPELGSGTRDSVKATRAIKMMDMPREKVDRQTDTKRYSGAGGVARHFRREERIPRDIVRQKSVELKFSSSTYAHRSPLSESGKELALKIKPVIPNYFKPAAFSTPNKMEARVDQKQRKEEEEVTLISTTWISTKPSTCFEARDENNIISISDMWWERQQDETGGDMFDTCHELII